MHPDIKIVSVLDSSKDVLSKSTEEFQKHELPLAKEIADKLYAALKPYFPAAGLAAPQIGISKSIFIFSFDRDPKNLEVVINPSFIPIENTKVEGWEGCLSVILNCWKLAKLSRYEKIHVQYLNLQGEKIEKILDGFAAKVFQHEYDHLLGIVNIYKEDSVVKSFTTEKEMKDFLTQVKKEDAQSYKKPDVS